MASLKGELRVGDTALPSFTRQFVFVTLGSALILSGFGVIGLVYGLFAGLFVLLVWGAYRTSISFGCPSLNHAKSLLNYSKYTALSSIGGYLYNWLDVVVIGFFLTQSHVGAYEVAWRVTQPVVLFSTAIATTIFPQVSRWDAEDNIEQIESTITRAITPSLLFVVPAFFGSLLFARDILTLVFGTQYSIAWLVLILLMGDKIFQGVQVIVGKSLQAIDHPNLAARAALISLVTNIVLNITLVWEFGLIGAAVGTVTASLLNDFLHIYYLSQFISLRFPWREIGWCFLSAIGMIAVLSLLLTAVSVSSVATLIGMITVGAVVYGVFVLLLPSIRERAWQRGMDLLVAS